MGEFVLVHSPLVGPLTWRAVAAELGRRGHRVLVPSLRDAFADGPPYYLALAAAVVDQLEPEGPAVTLVVHSGAGALVPAVVEALPRRVAAVVFVDALLPHGGRSWFDTAPGELAGQLRDLAVDGMLPPWHTWFPPEALAGLLPDEELRAAFVADVSSVPLAYFTEDAPAISRWEPQVCGYLLLSVAYDAAAGEAAAQGWQVRREPSDHLAMLTRPVAVADLVTELAGTTTR